MIWYAAYIALAIAGRDVHFISFLFADGRQFRAEISLLSNRIIISTFCSFTVPTFEQKVINCPAIANAWPLAEIYMTTEGEILKFITENSDEKLLNYFGKVCDKQKELNERLNKISIYFLLSALVFFILPFTASANIQVGPLTLSNNTIIYKLLPLFFSYISLEFAVVTNHKGEVMKILKLLSVHLYKQNVTVDYFKNPYRLNFFSRVIIPFSFWTELNNSLDKKVGCLGAILLLPALIVMFLPFYFEFVSLKFIMLNFWTDWITKFSVIVSLWLILITFYFYGKTMQQTYFVNKQDGIN